MHHLNLNEQINYATSLILITKKILHCESHVKKIVLHIIEVSSADCVKLLTFEI